LVDSRLCHCHFEEEISIQNKENHEII
jgi:hypothetical protein